MKEYIIASDVLSFLVVSVILYGVLTPLNGRQRTSTKMFIGLLFTALFAIAVDVSSYIGEKRIINDGVLRALNFMAYCFVLSLVDIFALYVISLVKEKINASYKMIFPVLVMSALNMIWLAIGTINGKLFTIVNHKFMPGAWHETEYIFVLIYVVYLFLVMFRFRRELTLKDVLALDSYLFFPLFFSGGQLVFGIPDFTYATITLAILVIYVTVQAQTISEAKLREKILNEVSYTDSLTGLKNRRAYEEFLLNDDPERNKCVAFFDLNYLKHTNDTLGHASGDKLLKDFAGLLNECFPDGEIFRISGDEFVVVLYSISADDVDLRMQNVGKKILEMNRIASFGYIRLDKGNMLQMVGEAEKLMYKDKALYYKETGRDRRV